MVNTVKINDQVVGDKIHLPNALVFFGNRFADERMCRLLSKAEQIHFLKQIHSEKIVLGGTKTQADGHWTKQKNLALGVETADCIPLVLAGKEAVGIFHAGWKGIELGIVDRAVETLISQGEESENLLAFLGPHISVNNFEVGLEVGTRLLSISPMPAEVMKHHPDPKKMYIDLEKIVSQKLRLKKIRLENIHLLKQDTFSNSNYFSYRRDGATGGRLITFVVLT